MIDIKTCFTLDHFNDYINLRWKVYGACDNISLFKHCFNSLSSNARRDMFLCGLFIILMLVVVYAIKKLLV